MSLFFVHSLHYLLPSSMLYYLLQMSGDQSGLTKPTVTSDPNFVDNRNVQMNGSAVLPQAYDEFGNAINENMVSHYSLGCFKLYLGNNSWAFTKEHYKFLGILIVFCTIAKKSNSIPNACFRELIIYHSEYLSYSSLNSHNLQIVFPAFKKICDEIDAMAIVIGSSERLFVC